MIITKKELARTLLSIGLCSSIITACSDNKNVDKEKKQLKLKTEQANNEIQNYKKEVQNHKKLSDELNQQIVRNKEITKENEALRLDLLKQEEAFSSQREEREKELSVLVVRIQATNEQIISAENQYADLKNRIEDETRKIEAKRQTMKQERISLEEEITKKRQLLSEEIQKKRTAYDQEERTRKSELANDIASLEEEITKKRQLLSEEIQKKRTAYDQEERTRKSELANDIASLEEEITKKRQLLSEEIQKKRTAYDQEERTRRSELANNIAAHQEELRKLESRLAEVVQREKDAASREASLKKSQEILASEQKNLQEDKENHRDAVQAFSEKIQAARDFFIKSNQGDIFAKLVNDSTFTFRMSLWGYGSVENIRAVRASVDTYNKENGMAENNQHKSYIPLLEKAKKENNENHSIYHIFTAPVLQMSTHLKARLDPNPKTKPFIFKEESDITFVNDSFIVTGTALEVKKFRDKANNMLEEQSNSKFAMATNMWFVARPIQEVRVNMKIQVLGSSSMSYDRKLKTIFKMEKLRPLRRSLKSFNSIDLIEPAQYILGAESKTTCQLVNIECLRRLKELGLLDHKIRLESKDQENSEIREATYYDYLSQIIETSIVKLRLHSAIKNAQRNGITIRSETTYKPVKFFESLTDMNIKNAWYSVVNGGFAPVKQKGTFSPLDQFRQNEELLKSLAAQPIVEKIEVTYEVSMVDTIDGNNGSLDVSQYLSQYATAGIIGKTKLSSQELLKRGELEIPLPISFENVSTTSDLVDLSLSDFTPSIVKPVMTVKAPEMVEVIPLQDQIKLPKEVLDALNSGQSTDTSSLTEEQLSIYNKFQAHINYKHQLAQYYEALKAHNDKMELYEEQIDAVKRQEYDNRILDHLSDLRQWLKALKK